MLKSSGSSSWSGKRNFSTAVFSAGGDVGRPEEVVEICSPASSWDEPAGQGDIPIRYSSKRYSQQEANYSRGNQKSHTFVMNTLQLLQGTFKNDGSCICLDAYFSW